MKLLKNKKSAVWFTPQFVMAIGLVLLLVFGGSGVVKFLFMDKTPLILGGLLILMVMLAKRRR